MSIRVLIADDHSLFRKGLVNLLSDVKDIEVVAEAGDGEEAIRKAIEIKPDVVIMDIGMPILNGVDATEKLVKKMPGIKVIALSMYSDKQYFKGMLSAGASGYLLKNCEFGHLIDAIHSAYKGKIYIDNEITNIMVQDFIGNSVGFGVQPVTLTVREQEVLKLLAHGKSTREIADSLFVSVKTISTHKQHILEKLNLKSTTELVKYALKSKIISLE